ncbi:hypothetical protein [Mesorhizobium sp. B263B2A]|uniref:hypothetical protein n=1 Tax=Mesorhizobium sp. B263B2A TaxID=2876669 RepID=UPI001CD179E0|nr:hypothetical protein [Mesorhizobium sp. B263B2A]MCA0032741.1 hypothetical protein [Mesorhizobium sp. B263B2A]
MAATKSRGRPEYEPTDEEREKVRVLKASSSMTNEAISEALGISVPTLRKYFSADLEVGAAKVTAEIIMARYNSAKAGNVAAQNKFLEMAGALPPRPHSQPKAAKLGKKEILDEEAQVSRASPGWGDVLQ